MAIERTHHFPIEFATAFPQGLVLVGEITPNNEYNSDRNAPARQKIDEDTGLREWAATVTDPHESKAKRASFTVILLAPVQ